MTPPRVSTRSRNQPAANGEWTLGPTILVADHEPDTREPLAVLLVAEFPGSRVVTADDGEAAVAALDRTVFDLAIIDYALPYMNGLEVARHAARMNNAPCVLVTGYSDPGIGAIELREGVLIGRFHKTAPPDEILRFVHGVLDPKLQAG